MHINQCVLCSAEHFTITLCALQCRRTWLGVKLHQVCVWLRERSLTYVIQTVWWQANNWIRSLLGTRAFTIEIDQNQKCTTCSLSYKFPSHHSSRCSTHAIRNPKNPFAAHSQTCMRNSHILIRKVLQASREKKTAHRF